MRNFNWKQAKTIFEELGKLHAEELYYSSEYVKLLKANAENKLYSECYQKDNFIYRLTISSFYPSVFTYLFETAIIEVTEIKGLTEVYPFLYRNRILFKEFGYEMYFKVKILLNCMYGMLVGGIIKVPAEFANAFETELEAVNQIIRNNSKNLIMSNTDIVWSNSIANAERLKFEFELQASYLNVEIDIVNPNVLTNTKWYKTLLKTYKRNEQRNISTTN